MKRSIRVSSVCMEPNIALDKSAVLAERVRAAQLPPPEERARIRRASRATLRDFAEVLGVTAMTVHRWETGEVEPRLKQAEAYGRLLARVAAASKPVIEEQSV